MAKTKRRPAARPTQRAPATSKVHAARVSASKATVKPGAAAKGAAASGAPAKRAAKPGASASTAPTESASKPPASASQAAVAPTPPRGELLAPRDVGRLLRYGERFGPHKIDIRMLPLPLPVASSSLALCDPGVPKTWRVLERPVAPGRFRVMLSIARLDGGAGERLAALVVHVGQPPIAKWTAAHFAGQKPPKTPEQLPRTEVTTRWLALVDAGGGAPGPIAVPAAPDTGLAPVEIPLTDGRRALAIPCRDGAYAAYWAVDRADKPVCLVVDFEAFTQKDWRAKPA